MGSRPILTVNHLHNVKLIGPNIGVCVGVVTCEQALKNLQRAHENKDRFPSFYLLTF